VRLINQSFIKNLLQQYNLRPNKRLGQNFLIDQSVLKKIIQTADISQNDTILEIGPGLGILTQELAKRAKRVIAIEKDKRLAEILSKELGDYNNIEIVHADILSYKLQVTSYKIVANLPYYITSPVIRLFLESENPPQKMILLIQKEVAQRICAQPPRMNLLAISVQFYAQPKIISYVSKKSFWPQPQVDSAIIKITQIQKPKAINPERFFQVVKAGFSSPRKQLANNLSQKLNLSREQIKKALTQCGLPPQIRAENLRVEDWICLYRRRKSL
jgi:16S rRNA (adenine1518-N6/adenine1519-N6)-dimethyltransferase